MDQAQTIIPCNDLSSEINFFEDLGYQLINIHPDDNPQVAVMRGFGQMLRIDAKSSIPPPQLIILSDEENIIGEEKTSPGGTLIKYQKMTYEVIYPQTKHGFEVRKLRGGEPWIVGRAGMQYRDLVPSRLGGGLMASHIHIPEGGPVPDSVHYHTIGFQLIYCYKGWVKLVYEDQGEPFILNAGDCVTQPPEIRHRVLEASDHLEVIEIGVPADHMTTIDHEMELPTGKLIPDREFGGQIFCHHKAEGSPSHDWKSGGFSFRETGVRNATRGMANVHVISAKPKISSGDLEHSDDILFSFILKGHTALRYLDSVHELSEGDAFVIPPGEKYSFSNCSEDFELLEVSLPTNS